MSNQTPPIFNQRWSHFVKRLFEKVENVQFNCIDAKEDLLQPIICYVQHLMPLYGGTPKIIVLLKNYEACTFSLFCLSV